MLSTSKEAGAVAMDAGLARPLGMEANSARPASAPERATMLPAAVAPASASPSSSSAAATSVPMTGRTVLARAVEEDWVESFFGLTREMILGMEQVNKMVARRVELLRNGTEDGEAGWTLRRAAERMVVQLGGGGGAGGGVAYGREDKGKARQSGSAFEVVEMAPGRSGRIRRGTTVSSVFDRERPCMCVEADSLVRPCIGDEPCAAHYCLVRATSCGSGRPATDAGSGEGTGNGGG